MSRERRILSPSPIRDLDDYRRHGGGNGLDAALTLSAGAIIDTVTRAGLRGRGGAGFPTGKKWSTIAASPPSPSRPVVVNAAEGEPGTFKDRILLRRNPYLVLEGALIAALAVGANEIIVATKASFAHELDRLRSAIAELEAAGWTTGFTVCVVEGPGEYLFGEETALLEVVDGRPPFPRTMAPYRRGVHQDATPDGTESSRRWGDGPVALVDNVETLANVPGIFEHGVGWYRSVGTPSSPGTIICTVTGDTLRDGCDEFAMGTPVGEVIDALGGGLETDHEIVAVLSGVSNPPLAAGQLHTPLSYEAMAAAGSGLGSASLVVIDNQSSLRAVAAGVARFLSIESCGQCERCKADSLAIAAELAEPGDARDAIDNRLATVARGARCALAGQVERVVGGLLQLDRAVLAGPRQDPLRPVFSIAPLVDLVGDHAVLDETYGDKRADWTRVGEQPDSGIWPVYRLADQPVEIKRGRSGELDIAAAFDGAVPAPFEELHQLHRTLEADLAAVRAASGADVNRRLIALGPHLELHRRIAEHLIYPLVDRLDLDDDLSWYPEHREQHAARLLQRLDLDEGPISPNLVDELCADVHTSIIELDLRLLPLIRRALDDDPDALLRVVTGINVEIGDAETT
jgi:NADH:ubiquinone oxidoreductase subunit F (NADH-binding)